MTQSASEQEVEVVARAKRLVAELLAPGHRQPVNPKANYRTRDIALFEEAAATLLALSSLRGGDLGGPSSAELESSASPAHPVDSAPLDLVAIRRVLYNVAAEAADAHLQRRFTRDDWNLMIENGVAALAKAVQS